ncbi:MAG: hypothetical protein ACRDNT_31715 [Streptosporangiaceae bacterium]
MTDALPTTSAGYAIRTHEIAVAQRAAGLDPHVATRCGYPVTQGRLDVPRGQAVARLRRVSPTG